MQIRAQLRANAVAMARHPAEYALCCYKMVCPSGYHGVHARVRHKSRARDHGNKTGKSGGGGQKK